MSVGQPKKPWRDRLTLPVLLTTLSLTFIVSVSAIVAFYALNVVYENKLKDTWAILFLDLEQSANRLGRQITAEANKLGKDDDGKLTILPGGKLAVLAGPLAADGLTAESLGLDLDSLGSGEFLSRINGQVYLLRASGPDNKVLRLWRLDLGPWVHLAGNAVGQSLVYVVSRQGVLLFSNADTVTPANVVTRPLVQLFIKSPLRQGQGELEGPGGAGTYGFYQEIPDTNLVLFAETDKAFALHDVKEIMLKFGGFVVLCLFIALLVLQLPLQVLVRPLRELTRLTTEVGQGNFLAKTKARGLGEVSLLTQAVESMSTNLALRDRHILKLQDEQKTKLRLEGELEIARGIQNNFLPKAVLPQASGFDLAATYVPASEVAGDWYGYYFEPASGDTLIAIADVSGHGTGAAMFTAVIAGCFEDLKLRPLKQNSLVDFAERLNAILSSLGKGDWHATMAIARLRPGSMELLTAGHCPPLMLGSPQVDAASSKFIRSPSTPLGFGPTYVPSVVTVPLAPRATVIFYTDGLIEEFGVSKRRYGSKRLQRVAERHHDSSASAVVGTVLTDWRKYTAISAADDVCIVAFKAIS